MSNQSKQILDMLRTGERTNLELASVTPRYGARVYDLRKAGHTINVTKINESLFTYALVGADKA